MNYTDDKGNIISDEDFYDILIELQNDIRKELDNEVIAKLRKLKQEQI